MENKTRTASNILAGQKVPHESDDESFALMSIALLGLTATAFVVLFATYPLGAPEPWQTLVTYLSYAVCIASAITMVCLEVRGRLGWVYQGLPLVLLAAFCAMAAAICSTFWSAPEPGDTFTEETFTRTNVTVSLDYEPVPGTTRTESVDGVESEVTDQVVSFEIGVPDRFPGKPINMALLQQEEVEMAVTTSTVVEQVLKPVTIPDDLTEPGTYEFQTPEGSTVTNEVYLVEYRAKDAGWPMLPDGTDLRDGVVLDKVTCDLERTGAKRLCWLGTEGDRPE